MSIPYTSGNFAVATPCSAPLFSAPIPGVNTHYMLTQDFVVNIANFAPLALDTPHPDYATFLLVAESAPVDLTGLKVRWTRVYAAVPAQHVEYQSTNYNFIGYFGNYLIAATDTTGGQFQTGVLARARQVKTVPQKIVSDYFLCATGQTYTTPDAIPISTAQRYTAQNLESGTVDVDFIADAPLYWQASSPSRTEYEALMAAAGWSIRSKDDELERWNGNIWLRRSFFVKPQ